MDAINYSQYNYLKVEKRPDRIAVVTIDRPEVKNAINFEVHQQLEYIWPDLQRDDDIDIIVLTGSGDAFAAGGDIARMAKRAGTEEGVIFSLQVIAAGRRIFANMLEVQKPIIAAVHGDAIGLGATLALFCDMIVMSQTARIGDPHVRIGLVAGDGGAVIWPALLGPARAKEFLMRGALLTGAEALQMGLVNYSLSTEEVMPKVMALAEELAKLPTFAVRLTKSAVNIHVRQQFNLVMDASIGFEALSMHSHDFAEGTRAFVEKRRPVFKGR